jgi:hypothetical protein
MKEKIFDAYPEEVFLQADGFDKAIIGVYEDKWGNAPMRLVYSIRKCILILTKEMSREEAKEYFYFNVIDAYMGEKTPIFIDDDF